MGDAESNGNNRARAVAKPGRPDQTSSAKAEPVLSVTATPTGRRNKATAPAAAEPTGRRTDKAAAPQPITKRAAKATATIKRPAPAESEPAAGRAAATKAKATPAPTAAKRAKATPAPAAAKKAKPAPAPAAAKRAKATPASATAKKARPAAGQAAATKTKATPVAASRSVAPVPDPTSVFRSAVPAPVSAPAPDPVAAGAPVVRPVLVSDVRVAVPANPGMEAGMVTLREEDAPYRAVSIVIGQPEARAIQAAWTGQAQRRPSTWDLFVSAIGILEARVTKAVITSVEESRHFFADIELQSGDRTRVLPARPSDAIALALRAYGAGIYVAEQVFADLGLGDPPATN